MRTVVWIVVWIVCVLVGAGVANLAGYGLWKLGFEIIGSAVALVGVGVGDILVLLWVLSWWDRRSTARA